MSGQLPPEVLARHDLISYCQLMDPSFLAPPHIRLLAWKLEQVAAGKIKRLIVNLPPRHGKSNLISRHFPAWYLGRHPEHQVINATHTADLSTDFGRDVRDAIEDEEYQRVFAGVRCKEDSKAANRFHVTKTGSRARGVYKALGRTGKKAGRGAHLLLIDDLLDEQEIYSEAAKEQARRAVRGLRTRVMPGGAIVLIMSRCGDDDPVAYVLDAMRHENWEVLAVPAIADEPEAHAMPDGSTWTREVGEALWPEMYPLAALEALRDGMPIHEWSSKFQRRPIPIGSRLVDEEWFKDRRYDDEPDDLLAQAIRIVLSGDTSKGTATGARTGLGVWAESERGAFLVEVAAERWQVPVIIDKLKAICEKAKPHAVLIEDKSTGEAIIQLLQVDPKWRWPIEAIIPPAGMDKVVRFAASTPAMKTGQVWLPRKGHPSCTHWQAKYEAELFHYPNVAEKDQGDMTSQFLNWRRENPLPTRAYKGWADMSRQLSESFDQDEPLP